MKKLQLLLAVLCLWPSLAWASESEGVINTSYRYAWSDKIGLIDLSNVKVVDDQLKGTANTVSMGLISFDDPSFKVLNDGAGNLSGSAYGSLTGLINFTGVKIAVDGYFAGVADGSFSAGKIYFDCTANAACPNASSARVATDWRPAASRQEVVVTNTIAKAAEAKNYSACDGLNDYLSYSRCVSEVDAKRSQTTALASEEPKSIDGEYSIKIGDASGLVNKTTVTLYLTAAKEAVDMIIARDNNFGFGTKQKVASTATWSIDDEQGVQTVYVKFYDKSGMPLKIVAATVALDKRQGDAAAEKEARTAFKALFGRVASESAVDVEALKIMAYGMTVSVPRDLAKEKTALAKFVSIYKHTPIVEQEWNMIKAYTYAEEVVKLMKSGPVVTTATPKTEIKTEVKATVVTKDCRPKVALSSNLDIGSKGSVVTALQESLKCQGLLATNYKVSGNYDQATELAVGAFQKANKILCADKTYCGAAGPTTRAKLNALAAIKTEVASPVTPTITAEVKASVATKVNLNRNLTLDMTGEDVSSLQKFLATDKAIYPEGLVTGKFGLLTEAAVKRWQTKYGLKCADGTACGYIGPNTRKKLNELMAK
jgi:peptidoglycan hydrolase-like protein with peptidoglycan-binding domain